VKSFFKWLWHREPEKNHHEVEVGNRNLAQARQVVESSSHMVDRALENGERIRQHLETSHRGLQRHLDELAERLKRLRQQQEENKR
jgi:hypothetical protein